MSPTLVYSAKPRLGRVLPWAATDGVLAVALSILFPIALALTALAAGTIGVIPRAWSNLLLADNPTSQIVQYLIALLLEAGIIIGLVWYRKASRADLGLRRFEWRWIGYTVVLYIFQLVVVYVAYSVVRALWPATDLNQSQDVYPFGHAPWAVWLSFVSSVLIAPVVEEMLFRGLLFGSLTKRLSVVVSALLSSVIFGLLHQQVNVAIYTFLLGLILCWLYKKTGSIIPGIILHLLNNIIAFWAITSGR